MTHSAEEGEHGEEGDDGEEEKAPGSKEMRKGWAVSVLVISSSTSKLTAVRGQRLRLRD